MGSAAGTQMLGRTGGAGPSQGSGWVRYLWPRPSDPTRPVPKLTYVREVKTPQGETLVVGSGLYE